MRLWTAQKQGATTGWSAWVVGTVAGTVTMVLVEYFFEYVDRRIIIPIAQACGMWMMWTVAWPWFRDQPKRRFEFIGHTLAMLAIAAIIAAIRIKLGVG